MRFRLGEDERLYLTLRTEVYLRLLPHLPKTLLSEVMRNLQKLEAMSYGEGIKQGMVVAATSSLIVGLEGPDIGSLPPITAHAQFYGEAQTPLVRVEEKRLADVRNSHPWLGASPVEFPPMTIAEAIAAYGPTLEPADASPRRREPPPAPVLADAAEEDDFVASDDQADDVEQDIEREIAISKQAADERGEDRAQSPDLLDRIRTQIKAEMQNGWEPKTWPDLVLRLMQSMGIDAHFIDLQLGGEQGRAVLDQCGLQNIFPGGGVMVGPSGEFVGIR